MSQFLTPDEASLFLHCKKSYIYQLVHRREIPFYKPNGGRILFDQAELETFVRKGKIATRTELADRAAELLNKRGSK